MCSWCEPTFDGYCFWSAAAETNPTVFTYIYSPSEYRTRALQSLIDGPLDLTIPYV